MYRPLVSSSVDWPTCPAMASTPWPTICMFFADSPAPVRPRVIWTWKPPAICAVWMATRAAAMPMPMTAALASSPVFLKAPAPASSATFISAFTSPMAVLTPLEWPRNSMKTGGRAPMRESPPSRVALRVLSDAGRAPPVRGPDGGHLRFGLTDARADVGVLALDALLVQVAHAAADADAALEAAAGQRLRFADAAHAAGELARQPPGAAALGDVVRGQVEADGRPGPRRLAAVVPPRAPPHPGPDGLLGQGLRRLQRTDRRKVDLTVHARQGGTDLSGTADDRGDAVRHGLPPPGRWPWPARRPRRRPGSSRAVRLAGPATNRAAPPRGTAASPGTRPSAAGVRGSRTSPLADRKS